MFASIALRTCGLKSETRITERQVIDILVRYISIWDLGVVIELDAMLFMKIDHSIPPDDFPSIVGRTIKADGWLIAKPVRSVSVSYALAPKLLKELVAKLHEVECLADT
jgi:hypothetical protein